MRRRAVPIAGLLALAMLAATNVAPAAARTKPSGARVGTGADQAIIERDGYGVPIITADTMDGVWFGAGWAQAQDRLVQMVLNRAGLEGNLSGLFGSDFLAQDQYIRTFFYTPAELNLELQRAPTWVQDALRSFSDGINAYMDSAYADSSSEIAKVPYELWLYGETSGLDGPYRPAPWRSIDTLAIANYLTRQFGIGGGSELDYLGFLQYLQAEFEAKHDPNASADAMSVFNDARWINDPTAPTIVQGGAAPAPIHIVSKLPAYLRAMPRATVARAIADLNRARDGFQRTAQMYRLPWREGSNAIAVSPSKSRDGHALLWGAPQEGFGTPSIDGEEYLHGPGFDVGGMYIVGEPFVLIGHNRNIAWTLTSGELYDTATYVEQVDFSTDPPTYLFNGQMRPMKVLHELIPVAGQNPQPFTVYRTVHGPVFSTDPNHGVAFSMKFASWKRELGSIEGFGSISFDQDLASFQDSVSKAVSLFNLTYADRQGNIAYFSTGLQPILPKCAACDPRLPHLGDGSQEWKGYEPFSQLAHVINPPQGYVENWNTKPDQAHYYQQNEGDSYWGTIYRSSRIGQLLDASNTIDKPYLLKIEHDIGTIDGDDQMRAAAPFFVPHLVTAYARLVKSGDPIVDATAHPLLAGAITYLRKWNRTVSLGSPAMYIYVEFMEALQRNLFGGGLNANDTVVGAVNLRDGSIGMGSWLGKATYNLTWHLLGGTSGLVPCGTTCYGGDYFGGHRDQILVESLNDAIALLSGKGALLGNGGAKGFNSTDMSTWGWQPYPDINWDQLDPLTLGVSTNFGRSPSQERSTYMQAIDLGPTIHGVNVLPPGQSGFIAYSGQPDPHFGDQVPLFNAFQYKPMHET